MKKKFRWINSLHAKERSLATFVNYRSAFLSLNSESTGVLATVQVK